MDIVITGRRTDVGEKFRRQAEDKLAKISQFAPRAHRVDVELSHERNRRQSDHCERVEITVRGRGPVIRAEASAEEASAALDLAFGKLVERLRRVGDRRKVHHGRHAPPTLRQPNDAGARDQAAPATFDDAESAYLDDGTGDGLEDGLSESPVLIRTKDHRAVPMTLEQALYEMELVGHDFFLFIDAGCGRPSVVYRRRGWNYGVIRLQLEESTAGETDATVQVDRAPQPAREAPQPTQQAVPSAEPATAGAGG